MSQGRKTEGSLKLHRHKPREGQFGDRLPFSLHNIKNRDIMEIDLGDLLKGEGN